MVVVVQKFPNGELKIFGPFKDGTEATRWGFRNINDKESDAIWWWDDVISPPGLPVAFVWVKESDGA